MKKALVLLLATGCASPSSDEIQQNISSQRSRGAYISFPPVSQEEKGHCGPAALAAVARYFGSEVSVNSLAADIYSEEAEGSFTSDLSRKAKEIGFAIREVRNVRIAGILKWIDSNVPIIVLMNVGNPLLSSLHYQIIVGYDDTLGWIVVKDSDGEQTLSYSEFAERWRGYALALLRQEDVAPLLDAENDSRTARELYLTHLRRFPVDLIAAYNYARLEAAVGDTETAKRVYEFILDLSPRDCQTANNLADLFRREGKELERAEHLVRMALDNDPSASFWYRETLAEVLLAQGRAAEAREELKIALSDARAPPDLRERLRTLLEANQ